MTSNFVSHISSFAFFTTLSSAGLLTVGAISLSIVLNVARQLFIPTRSTDPPQVFHWIPVVGSAVAYGRDPLKFFLECRNKYGNMFTFTLVGRRVTVALGPKGNSFILDGKSSALSSAEAYKHLLVPLFGKDVVFGVPHEVFMEQKKLVKTALNIDNLCAYVGMIEEEVEQFVKRELDKELSEQWSTLNATHLAEELILHTAARTLLGKEARANLNAEYRLYHHNLMQGLTPVKFIIPFSYLPLPTYRKRDSGHAKMNEFYLDVIRKRKAAPLGDDVDVISSLLQQSYRTGQELSVDEIAQLMISTHVAGHHTCSTTASWALLQLAANPSIAEKVYREQVERFTNPDGSLRSFTYQELRSLPMLNAVIRETLRVYPPVRLFMRYVTEDVLVPTTVSAPSSGGQYVVPAGNYLLSSAEFTHIDPLLWTDAPTWDPYRWMDSKSADNVLKSDGEIRHGEKIDYGFGLLDSKGAESSYYPFGSGRHRCIGDQFAYMELGTVIATLVRAIEMRIDRVPPRDFSTIASSPQAPCEIRYRRRSS